MKNNTIALKGNIFHYVVFLSSIEKNFFKKIKKNERKKRIKNEQKK